MLNELSARTQFERLPGELLRFLGVGVAAVAIDFVTYRTLLLLGVAIAVAKAASFITGAVFAYAANRNFTFRAGERRPQERRRFIAVYGIALLANVLVNHAVLGLLGSFPHALTGAFLVATGVSATMNFTGMKLLVFREASSTPTAGMTNVALADTGDLSAPRLSLVIPCYNESANLPLLVGRLREVFTDERHEVILVDNGSTDDSPAVLAALLAGQDRLRSVRVEVNQGYGHGILTGLRAARGDVIGWTHADMQTDPLDALRALPSFSDGAGFVKGRRYGRPASDVVFTVGMSLFETLLLRRPLWDINAQPTLFPRRFFDTWRQPPHDFSLDLYAYALAREAGLAVRRLPVHFGARAHGVSSWNVDWRAKARFIRRTVDFSLRLRKEL